MLDDLDEDKVKPFFFYINQIQNQTYKRMIRQLKEVSMSISFLAYISSIYDKKRQSSNDITFFFFFFLIRPSVFFFGENKQESNYIILN